MLTAFRAVKIRTKLILSYLVIFVLAMSVFTAFVQYTSRRSIIENNKRIISGMTAQSTSLLALKMEQINGALELCAFQEELQEVYYNRMHSIYALAVKLSDLVDPFYNAVRYSIGTEVVKLSLYSETGLHTYGSSIVNTEADRNADWYKKAMGERGIHWNLYGSRIYVTLRVDPISRLFGSKPLGVICLQLDAKEFLFNYIPIEWKNSMFTLSDSVSGDVFSSSALPDGIDETVTIKTEVPKTGWTIEYTADAAVQSEAERAIYVSLVGVIAVSAGAMIFIVAIFSRAILRGLNELKNGMKRVRKGDLSVRMKVLARDEIGMLTVDFNNMLETIEGYIEEIKENERQLSSLEYRSLRNQIDPHFLYNTLSFIRWKCLREGLDDARTAVEQLSVFYRTCLNKGGDFTTVENEMNNIKAYADIQLLLHDHSFDIEYDVPESLYARSIPCFVVQPLVENAIVHGVDEREEERGKITIRLVEQEENLLFTVCDNGPGLLEGVDAKMLIDSPKSVGISNVNERIRLLVGEKYGYSIRNIEGGCEASLTLPLGKE